MPATQNKPNLGVNLGVSETAAADYSTILTPENRVVYVESEVLNLSLELMKRGLALAFMGESGFAKTDLARALMLLAKQGGLIQHTYSQEYGGVVSGDLLDGERTLDENGRITIIPSQWLQAVRHAAKGVPVGLINDEHNRGTPQGLNKQLRAFSHQEYVSDLDGILTWKQSDLLMISTLNVGFEFSGTSPVDQALASRLYPLILKAPPPDIIERILNDRYDGIDKQLVKNIVRTYSASRTSEDAYKLSVRDVLKIADGTHYAKIPLKNTIYRIIGGVIKLNGMDEEAVEALITAVASLSK